ncbi:triose-phosphate isomerase [Candidatus Erwinia haradaeae]|uniref:Triosephosphate isomerase n=1 Tax=Candidatus Erwinia haradaeae TaxID=1922217 RepID=A0A451DMQ1_9GAMM|nr:triose-phosphate isomerase [Candidatus Erwinia haradaeae]VFP88021.1 Triosephosphate isomerase [Candidatus Erwinia haradaeae]
MRHPLVIGNWKLNGSKKFIDTFIAGLCHNLYGIEGCKVVIAPPMVYLDQAKKAMYNSTLLLGAQNVDMHHLGAFTGEISVSMLKDIGVKYVIIGHSERRSLHLEDDQVVAKKFFALKNTDLIPVLCIGETAAEKMAGKTKTICARQIDVILQLHGANVFQNTVIAYEPIWAIGTGCAATSEQIQTIHKFIRDHIAQKDSKVADQLIIQYGGSVTKNNAAEIFSQPDIDGVLVGSSSLRLDSFIEIIKLISTRKHKI